MNKKQKQREAIKTAYASEPKPDIMTEAWKAIRAGLASAIQPRQEKEKDRG